MAALAVTVSVALAAAAPPTLTIAGDVRPEPLKPDLLLIITGLVSGQFSTTLLTLVPTIGLRLTPTMALALKGGTFLVDLHRTI